MLIYLNMVLTEWMVSENILVNALVQIAGCTILGFGIAMVYVGVTVRLFNKHLAWFDRLLHYHPRCRRYVYGLARYIRRQI